MKLIQFINLGGPINWVLCALLCFCFCQCIERGVYFFQTRRGSKRDVLLRLRTRMGEVAGMEREKREKTFQSECSILY